MAFLIKEADLFNNNNFTILIIRIVLIKLNTSSPSTVRGHKSCYLNPAYPARCCCCCNLFVLVYRAAKSASPTKYHHTSTCNPISASEKKKPQGKRKVKTGTRKILFRPQLWHRQSKSTIWRQLLFHRDTNLQGHETHLHLKHFNSHKTLFHLMLLLFLLRFTN